MPPSSPRGAKRRRRIAREAGGPGRDYDQARAAAQAAADASGFDFGLERTALGWTYFLLPRRENRSGHELRCEVVSPTDLERCRPGHGPARALCSDRAGVIRW